MTDTQRAPRVGPQLPGTHVASLTAHGRSECVRARLCARVTDMRAHAHCHGCAALTQVQLAARRQIVRQAGVHILLHSLPVRSRDRTVSSHSAVACLGRHGSWTPVGCGERVQSCAARPFCCRLPSLGAHHCRATPHTRRYRSLTRVVVRRLDDVHGRGGGGWASTASDGRVGACAFCRTQL